MDRSEEDPGTLLRELHASMSADLTAISQRMTDLGAEVGDRIRTFETAILNALRDQARESDCRFEPVSQHLEDAARDRAELRVLLERILGHLEAKA